VTHRQIACTCTCTPQISDLLIVGTINKGLNLTLASVPDSATSRTENRESSPKYTESPTIFGANEAAYYGYGLTSYARVQIFQSIPVDF